MPKKSEPAVSLYRLFVLGVPLILVALMLRMFVFGLYLVPTSSMAPTLLIGDYILASKYSYGSNDLAAFSGGMLGGPSLLHIGRGISRGDVVVFKSPWNNQTLVKRLIGMPGDHIQMVRSELYVNGKVVKRERLQTPVAFPGDDEPSGDIVDYIEYLPGAKPHYIRLIRELEDEETVNNTEELVVPLRSYFFMGDNRDNSEDSRVSDVGFVPEENILGRVETTFFSMSKSAHIWEFQKWKWAVRWHRLFAKIY